MNLIEFFDKWINERGSASILRERILLLVEKTTSLEQKQSVDVLRIIELEKLLSEATTAKKHFELENSNLREQVLVLKKEIEKLQPADKEFDHNSFHEIEWKILLLLASVDRMSDVELSQRSGVGKQTIKLQVEELIEKRLVENLSGYLETRFALSTDGKKLMFKLGHLH